MLRPLLQEATALERVVARLNIMSTGAFSLAGTVTRIAEQGDLRQQANALVSALGRALYDHAYSRELKHSLAEIPDALPDPELRAALHHANASKSRWDRGWSIDAGGNAERFVVRKRRAARLVEPGEFLLEDPFLWPPAHGARVRLRVPRAASRLQSSFYFAFGETLPAFGPEFDLVRFYWNVQLAGAAELVRILTTTLNRFRIPFRLKCLTIKEHYDRVDPAVLFVQKRFFPITAQLLTESRADLAPLLSEATPLFTKRLAPGLAVAENPFGGGSFGTERCKLLAEGLWDAHVACASSSAEKLICVQERFSAAGLSLDEPHLEAGGTIKYALPRAHAPAARARETRASSHVDVAAEIGAVLCRNALWSGNQCAWFGDYYERIRSESVLVYGSLGGNLYGGSAGIALFLAELARARGNRAFVAVARAGAEHAIASARDTLLRHGVGFYTGVSGVAQAVVRVGELLEEEGLVERALEVMATSLDLGAQPNASDVLSGWAGSSVVLLELCERYANEQVVDFALELAEQVIPLAPEEGGSGDAQPLLTGFSHGAAGYAWALSEVFARTRDDRFRRAAQRFLAYERRFYDDAEQNWQDLRSGCPEHSEKPLYSSTWCNGAAGIALGRARMNQLMRNSQCEEEAEIALQTTARLVQQEINSSGKDHSLCHGVTGCADVLLYADQLKGTKRFSGLVQELADLGSRRYRKECAWPSGVSGGDNPGLLLGLAGTGYFYLRLSDPDAVPTILLPGSRP